MPHPLCRLEVKQKTPAFISNSEEEFGLVVREDGGLKLADLKQVASLL